MHMILNEIFSINLSYALIYLQDGMPKIIVKPKIKSLGLLYCNNTKLHTQSSRYRDDKV